MMKRISLIVCIALFSVLVCGCPPKTIRQSNPYVQNARDAVQMVKAAYPALSGTVTDACTNGLLKKETCDTFEEIDPIISDTLDSLETAIATYQTAVADYEEATKTGDPELEADAYTRVNAALSVVVGQSAELLRLYFNIVTIVKQIQAVN